MTQIHHYRLPFGAEIGTDGTTRFRIWAPSCDSLKLRLGGEDHPMHAEEGGWFALSLPAPAGTEYHFVMPDGTAVTDPVSRLQKGDVHGPSVVVDPASYQWKTAGWTGLPWRETVLYELHVGLCGGFKGVQAMLPDLVAIGITAVELMPLSEFPGDRNWGYDGVLPYAPDGAYGTPDELKAMIDAAHGLGISVFLDVVYNHFGPDGAYIHAFANKFFREDIHTPWGAAIDFRRTEVREYFINNAIYWINEYRFDGLRFDAVHAITSDDFLVEMAGRIRGAAPGRHVHLVLENEMNDASLLGQRRYDAQWTDDFHHAMHVVLTGETEGYYEDFEDATALLARCLAEGFAYQGEVSKHSGKPRGQASGHLPTTSFVICLQNHDQTGNRALGERLTVLADPAALKAATALLLLSPFIPMLLMGEEHASTSPFLFFTDHNDDLAKLVDEGRRNEFKHFAAFKDETKRDLIPAPNSKATFDRSRPERTDPAHADWVAQLLRLRREQVVPGIEGCRSLGSTVLAAGAVKAEWAMGDGKTLTMLLNLGKDELRTEPPGRRALYVTPGAAPDRLPPGSIAVLLA